MSKLGKISELETKCDICGGPDGNIWCHSDGGIGSPIRYGDNLNVCKTCNKNKKKVDSIQKTRMAKNRKAAQDSLMKRIYDNTDVKHEDVYYAFEYWFRSNYETIEKYEAYLGFKLPEYFKNGILELKCDECGKGIRVPTEEECGRIVRENGLEHPGARPEPFSDEERKNSLWFKKNGSWTKAGYAEWNRRYDAGLSKELREYDEKTNKIRLALKPLFTSRKYLLPYPNFPESLNKLSGKELTECQEYLDYKKLYDEYRDSQVRRCLCSRECQQALYSRDKEFIMVNY